MSLFFVNKKPFPHLFCSVAFCVAAFFMHGFAVAQETAQKTEDPAVVQYYKDLQEFKEGRFKPLYSPSIYDDAVGPTARFDPMKYEEFSMIETEMRYMIYVQEQNHVTNHLCAVGYVLKSGKREVVVVWREAGLLMRWRGEDVAFFKEWGFHVARSMNASPTTDLNRLVDDRTGFLGNGAIAYREDAEGTVADCKKHGTQYVIKPFTPPPRTD
jgi:hypothetical protein